MLGANLLTARAKEIRCKSHVCFWALRSTFPRTRVHCFRRAAHLRTTSEPASRMVLERYPSSTSDARATRAPRQSGGTHVVGAGISRVALFFIVLGLAPRATRGQWQSPGESCSSDFDCYQATMCAGGVCCLDGRGEAGMQNCTQCKLAYIDPDDPYDVLPPYEDEEDGVCTDCAEGFENVGGTRCRQICDSATQYRQYDYYCYAKGNAGSFCRSNDQCLSGLCGQNNYCCDCDARMADENGHYCVYCTPGNGTCAARSASAFSPSGQCLNDTYVGGSAVSSGQSSAGNNNSSAGRNNSTDLGIGK